MSATDLVFCVLWASRLALQSNVSAVKQIWQSSRRRNSELGLTGVAVFDGERVCELLEGPIDDISAVYRDVEFDPRLSELLVLHICPAGVPRRMTEWRSGYCDAAALDPFFGHNGVWGEAAVSAFVALLPRCELSP